MLHLNALMSNFLHSYKNDHAVMLHLQQIVWISDVVLIMQIHFNYVSISFACTPHGSSVMSLNLVITRYTAIACLLITILNYLLYQIWQTFLCSFQVGYFHTARLSSWKEDILPSKLCYSNIKYINRCHWIV